MDAKRADEDADDGRATGPEADFRAAVEAVMARIVDGEREATWELHDLAEPSLTRMLRAEARRIDFRIGEEDIFDLTLDAAIDLAKLAHSWRPDGALPWVWARARVLALVHGHIGTFADELDDSHLDLEAPPVLPRIEEPREVLRQAARRHAAARDLDRRLAAVSERDADVWLGVQLERAAGNRSPAVTVAVDHDMQPAAVRKVVQRVGERLSDVA